MAEFLFDICPTIIQNLLQYWLRGRILRPKIIIFLLRLLFDLDITALILASRTILESGPRFAGICKTLNKPPALHDVLFLNFFDLSTKFMFSAKIRRGYAMCSLHSGLKSYPIW